MKEHGVGSALVVVLAGLAFGLLFSPPMAQACLFAEGGRDAFPVFDNPTMLTGAQAEARRLIFPRDAVIGVAYGGEAKAYPVRVMGIHELGNDTIGGKPIAISW